MRPIYLLLFLAIYTPFEDCFLFLFHPSVTMLAAAKAVPELMIYATLAIALALRQIQGKRITVTGIEGLIVVFCISAMATTYAYGGDMLQGLINLKSLFRYYSLTLIAINSDFSRRDLDWMIRAIVLGAAFQALLSIACVIIPALGNAFHYLRQINGAIPEKVGSQFGTFANEAICSVFYLVALAFLFSRAYKPKIFNATFVRWCLIGLVMVGIALTMKRAAVLAAVAAYMLLLVIEGKRVRAGIIASFAGIVGVCLIVVAQFMGTSAIKMTTLRTTGVDPIEFATELFTSDYWQHSADDSRGWVMTDVLPNLIISPRITGFGADPTAAQLLFVHDHPWLSQVIGLSSVEDVYWCAVFMYYGQIGAVILLWILLWFALRIYMGRRYLDDPFEREISSAAIMMIVISILYAFVVRIFEFRAFSFYFWMFLGVAFQQYRNARRAKMAEQLATNPLGLRRSLATRKLPAPATVAPQGQPGAAPG